MTGTATTAALGERDVWLMERLTDDSAGNACREPCLLFTAAFASSCIGAPASATSAGDSTVLGAREEPAADAATDASARVRCREPRKLLAAVGNGCNGRAIAVACTTAALGARGERTTEGSTEASARSTWREPRRLLAPVGSSASCAAPTAAVTGVMTALGVREELRIDRSTDASACVTHCDPRKLLAAVGISARGAAAVAIGAAALLGDREEPLADGGPAEASVQNAWREPRRLPTAVVNSWRGASASAGAAGTFASRQ